MTGKAKRGKRRNLPDFHCAFNVYAAHMCADECPEGMINCADRKIYREYLALCAAVLGDRPRKVAAAMYRRAGIDASVRGHDEDGVHLHALADVVAKL